MLATLVAKFLFGVHSGKTQELQETPLSCSVQYYGTLIVCNVVVDHIHVEGISLDRGNCPPPRLNVGSIETRGNYKFGDQIQYLAHGCQNPLEFAIKIDGNTWGWRVNKD